MKKLAVTAALIILPFMLACPKRDFEPARVPEVPEQDRFRVFFSVYDEEHAEWLTVRVCVHSSPDIPAEFWPSHVLPLEVSKTQPQE